MAGEPYNYLSNPPSFLFSSFWIRIEKLKCYFVPTPLTRFTQKNTLKSFPAEF